MADVLKDWREEYAYTLGLQAYIYGFPWVFLPQLRWQWVTQSAKSDEKGYRIHFAPDGLPPVKAFWSITMYGKDNNLVANPINRYSIGDRTPGSRLTPGVRP